MGRRSPPDRIDPPPITDLRADTPRRRLAPRRGRATAVVSLVLHGAVLLAVIYLIPHERRGDPSAENGVDIIMVPGRPDQVASQDPVQAQDQSPAAQATAPQVQPSPQAETQPEAPPPTPQAPPEAEPPPPPAPATPPEPPPPPQVAEQPMPIPPLASLQVPDPIAPPDAPPPPPPQLVPPPLPASRPSVRLSDPDDSAPPRQDFAMPQPPPPLPPPPVPRPRPVQPRPTQPRLAQPAAPQRPVLPGTQFAAPMELNFGPAVSRPGRPPRGFDLALGAYRPAQPSQARRGSDTDIRAPDASPEWMSLLRTWWEQHKYYPRQAAENNEDGDVTVNFRVDRDGRVSGLQLVRRSGSMFLDLGAQATFRGQQLPRLPPDSPKDQIDVSVTIHYMLIRR